MLFCAGSSVEKQFKSPPHKLISHFQGARDKWRTRHHETKAKLTLVEHQVRAVEKSRGEWRNRCKQAEKEAQDAAAALEGANQRTAEALERFRQLESQLDGGVKKVLTPQAPPSSPSAQAALVDVNVPPAKLSRPPKHRYTLLTITTLLCTVIASVPMRAAARAYAIFEAEKLSLRLPCPSYSSVRLWLLRVGVYRLTKAIQQAEDWIYVADHCVRIGSAKLFVILGVRLGQLPDDFRLEKSQMTVVHIEVMNDANRFNVKTALDTAAKRTGIPCQIVSDGGSDIKCGISLFQDDNPHVIWSYDIHHKVAAEFKALAEADNSWGELSASLAQFKLQVQQTDLAALAPPAQRGKARYMNIDVLLAHLRKCILPVFRQPELYANTLGLPAAELALKLAWVGDHLQTVRQWEQFATVGEVVRAAVNQYGYGEAAVAILDNAFGRYISTFPQMPAAQLASRLLAFVAEQSLPVPPAQRILGSSEIIESLFGQLKQLLGEYAKNGFTGLVAVVAAIVSPAPPAEVMQALATVSTKDALTHVRAMVGPTVQQTRRQLRKIVKATKTEQNPGKVERAA
jgi:hypothetical protein